MVKVVTDEFAEFHDFMFLSEAKRKVPLHPSPVDQALVISSGSMPKIAMKHHYAYGTPPKFPSPFRRSLQFKPILEKIDESLDLAEW